MMTKYEVLSPQQNRAANDGKLLKNYWWRKSFVPFVVQLFGRPWILLELSLEWESRIYAEEFQLQKKVSENKLKWVAWTVWLVCRVLPLFEFLEGNSVWKTLTTNPYSFKNTIALQLIKNKMRVNLASLKESFDHHGVSEMKGKNVRKSREKKQAVTTSRKRSENIRRVSSYPLLVIWNNATDKIRVCIWQNFHELCQLFLRKDGKKNSTDWSSWQDKNTNT